MSELTTLLLALYVVFAVVVTTIELSDSETIAGAVMLGILWPVFFIFNGLREVWNRLREGR